MDTQLGENADVERKLSRRNGFTSFQQSRKKLLSGKSCTGVTGWCRLQAQGPARSDIGRVERAKLIDSKDFVMYALESKLGKDHEIQGNFRGAVA